MIAGKCSAWQLTRACDCYTCMQRSSNSNRKYMHLCGTSPALKGLFIASAQEHGSNDTNSTTNEYSFWHCSIRVFKRRQIELICNDDDDSSHRWTLVYAQCALWQIARGPVQTGQLSDSSYQLHAKYVVQSYQ